MSTPKPISPQQNKLMANRALLLATIGSVVGIIAIILAGLAWYKVGRLSGGIESEVKALQVAISVNKSQAAVDLGVLKAQIKDQQQVVNDAKNKIGHILKAADNNHQLRTLGQVAYLLHLANLHLNVGHDTDTALKLLEMAQKRVNTLPSASLYNLKKAISHDISSLESAPKINVTNLVIQLNTLDDKIQKIQIAPKGPVPKSTPTKTAPQTQESQHWTDKVSKFFSGFSSLISIRHINEPVMPLLTPAEANFLKENIQIKINQAEWSVLNGNNAIYQKSLEQVQQWLTKYYGARDDMSAIFNELNTLIKTNITPAIPDIKDSLDAIENSVGNQASVPAKKSGAKS